MSHDRAMRVFALAHKHLVVAQDVNRSQIVSGMPGKYIEDRLGARILVSEIKIGPNSEECAESLLELDATIVIPHQRRQANRRMAAVLKALLDGRLQGAMRCNLKNDVRPSFVHHGRNPIGEQDWLPDV